MNKIIYIISGILVLAGAAMGVMDVMEYASYVMGVGSLGIVLLALNSIKTDTQTDKRTSRLLRINLFVSLLLPVGAYLMYNGSNSWVVMVLTYALNVLMLSTRK